MTATSGFVPLFLVSGGSHCLVDIKQRPIRPTPRRKHRSLCKIVKVQRASPTYIRKHEKTLLAHQHTIYTMASHHRRRSSFEKASIESILKTGDSGQPAAAPPAHVGNSPNRAYFTMSPTSSVGLGHSRTSSSNPRRPNRLSLSFPVAPSTNTESSRPLSTSSNNQSFPPTPSITPETTPNDPGSFLVALAGQERRVLELKEELAKAEWELKTLKRQWASHESHKKKAEIRHVEPLQPLQSIVTGGEEAAINTRQSAEMDRRRAALLGNLSLPKDNRRKFSGAHTRTLSLLSPERSNFREPRPFPPVEDSGSETSGLTRIATLPTMRTMPDTSQGITRISLASNRARHSYQSGGVTHGAKQIAEDVKAGLWTFLEDLRQATVGDEAVNGPTSRTTLESPVSKPVRNGSKGSLLGNERAKRNSNPRARTWETLTGETSLMDAEGVWPELDQPLEPSTRVAVKKVSRPISLAAPALDDLDDDWGSWDSPTPKSPRWSGSTTSLTPATPSNASDENVTYVTESTFPPFIPIDNNRIKTGDEPSTPSKRDSIQWPALDKLTATNLRGGLQRTMSTIMTEWEKSITPPGERADPMSGDSDESTSNSQIQDQILMSR